MTLETFFEKFDQFADAPHAVAKMRELVLQWAVQGRLVRQDCNEEPASSLIRGAVRARKTLVAAKAVREAAPDLSFLDELENGLPPGWVYAPLSVYVGVIMGQSPPSSAYNETGEGLPFYQGKAQFGRLYPTATDWCTEPTKIGEPEDVVISVRAPVGPTNMLRERSCIGRGLASLRSLGGDQMHLLYTLRAVERDLAAMGVGSTFAAISKSDLDDFRIPVPPLGEQKRIVKKVDQLMELCDRLEAQQQERGARHAVLASAALARFADAPTPANLELLFHPTYTIAPADLRKSILTLAVQGRLVPQDLTEEPAADLVDRIAAHKAALAKEGRLRGSTSVSPMADGGGDFGLPSNWCWVRFGELMVNRDGERIPVSKEERETKTKLFDYYGASGVIDKIDGYLFDKPLLLIGEDGANLINRSTPIAFIARGKYWVNNHAHVLDGISEEFLQFIALCINAINLEKYITGSAQPKMNQAKMNSIPIGLPPLAEQRRIVARVDQLMALVDELETQLTASRATAADLLSAVVSELTGTRQP